MTTRFLIVLLLASFPALLTGQQSAAAPRVVMTHAPVVESSTASTAVIAWSTNVSAGTLVRYGTDRARLTARREMPWGGYTHRVTLSNLQPGTTYFFQASSPDAQGSGGTVESEVGQFTTAAH
jgi:phosphodiesterase/alkaline phosphatase D-like protein